MKGGAIEGESLLLPLLQGLLDAPESDQPADSGTESGEDLRSSLIMEVQSALDKLSASLRSDSTDISPERRTNLLHLVTKLQAGLSTQPPKTERRNSSSARFAARKRPRQSRHTVGVSSEELADARRLMEEIAFRDVPSLNITPSTSGSRITPSASQSSILQKQNSEGSVGQQSTSSFRSVKLSHHKPLVKNAVAKPFSNSTSGTSSSVETPTDPTDALHFLFASNEEQKQPEVTYTETAQVQLRPKKVPPPTHRQSLTLESENQVKDVKRPLSEAVTSEVDIKSVQQAVKQAARIKQLSESRTDEEEEEEIEEEEEEESETEEEPTTLRQQQQQRKASLHEYHEEPIRQENIPQRNPYEKQKHPEEQLLKRRPSEEQRFNEEQKLQKLHEDQRLQRPYDEDRRKPQRPYEDHKPQNPYEDQKSQRLYEDRRHDYYQHQQPKPDLILQTNPIYSQPSQYRNSKEMSPEEKYNRFSSKKMRMKRANTIDIPKPLNFYECDDEDDSDYDQQDERRNSYLGLRGPIQVGRLNTESKVPTFQPKTDSDKKFMAFLNKHNENAANKSNLWTNRVHNWNNKFGNIRTTFEKVSQPVENVSTARNFWKSADDAVTVGSVTNHGPKISRQSARNLQEMFEQKQKQNENKMPWTTTVTTKQNVVTGSLKLDPKGFENKTHRFSQPSPPINQFTHAPQSAFKPIQKKAQPSPPPTAENPQIMKSAIVDNSDTTLYLYCPKPLYSPTDSQSSSPIIHSKPFLQTGENKAVNKAASRFEQVAQQKQQPAPPAPRRANKVSLPPTFQQQQPQQQQLAAPYLVNRAEQKNSAVRKLSDQYDSRGVKNDNYSSYTSVRQSAPFEQKKPTSNFGGQPHHYVPPTKPVAVSAPKPQPPPPKHHYTPQYNQPQQFIQPTQTKPEMYKAKLTEKDQNQNFTSNYVYQPQKTKAQQTYQASTVKTTQKVYQEAPKAVSENKVEYERQGSRESYKEYTAPVAKVMTGPVSQQAVTVRQKSPMNRDEHEMERAFSLRNALQKTTQQRTLSSGSFKTKYEQERASRTPSPNPQQYRYESSPRTNFALNGKRFSMESVETNEEGEAVVTSRFSIPVVNIAPATPQALQPPCAEQVLSKSDSWHQICQQTQSQKPPSPNTKSVVKSKSLHTLAVPKLFEAGMTKEEMALKKRTMEAFFSGGDKSPQSLSKSNSRESLSKSNSRENLDKHEPARNKSSINRIKTSEKISIHRHAASGLARSRTLPDIVCPEMLDESNVDKAFEDLFRSSS